MSNDSEKQLNPNTTSNGGDLVTSLETSENDPCMGNSKEKKGKSWDVQTIRDDVCRKTGLTHKGFYYVGAILVLCILLLIVVIALAAAWPHVPHSQRFPVCKEAACLRASAQIREAINSSSSPCTDLWNWTCGGWLSKYPLPKNRSIWNQKQQLMKIEREKVRDLIATLKLPIHSNTVECKLKYLYEACLDVDNVNSDKAGPLTDIINQLGGWYILRTWNEADFDKNVLLRQLFVKYGVTPYFKFTVEPNPQMPGRNTIRISPAGLGLPDKEYYYTDQDDRVQTAYKKLIRDITQDLSTTTIEAMKFGVDIFSYEKRIAEVTPDLRTLQNPISTYNVFTLSELKDVVQLPLFDILSNLYPDSNITENTEVIVTSLEYLQAISGIISSTDRKIMNGYLIWTLVRTYLPYLSDRYTLTLDAFNSELYGIQASLERWETCSLMVKQYMNLAIEVFSEEQDPITEDTYRFVNETFHSVLGVVQSKILKYVNNQNFYGHLKSKLKTLKLQVSLPKKVKNANYLKEYYSKLQILKSNLFQSVKNGILFLKKLEERRLMTSPEEDNFISSVEKEIPKVKYIPAENAVVIPRILLTQPVFENRFPKPIIYGRLGVEITEAILSAILPYDSFWTDQRKILSQFHTSVDDSLHTVNSTINCLSHYVLGLNLAVPYSTVNETALQTIKHIMSVSIANQALIESIKNSPHTHQPGLEEFEDSALFFLTYGQTQCSESTSQQQLYENIVNFGFSQRTLLYLTWSQVPEFADSFDCNFNKNDKCSDIF